MRAGDLTIPSVPIDERFLFPMIFFFFLWWREVLHVAAVRWNLPWLHLRDPAAWDIHLHTLGSESRHLEGGIGLGRCPSFAFYVTWSLLSKVYCEGLKLIFHSLRAQIHLQ